VIRFVIIVRTGGCQTEHASVKAPAAKTLLRRRVVGHLGVAPVAEQVPDRAEHLHVLR
jgi:hypothetical protein